MQHDVESSDIDQLSPASVLLACECPPLPFRYTAARSVRTDATAEKCRCNASTEAQGTIWGAGAGKSNGLTAAGAAASLSREFDFRLCLKP